jgi:hypothetical protein
MDDHHLTAGLFPKHQEPGSGPGDVLDARGQVRLVGPAPHPGGHLLGQDAQLKQPADKREPVHIHVPRHGIRMGRLSGDRHAVHLAK